MQNLKQWNNRVYCIYIYIHTKGKLGCYTLKQPALYSSFVQEVDPCVHLEEFVQSDEATFSPDLAFTMYSAQIMDHGQFGYVWMLCAMCRILRSWAMTLGGDASKCGFGWKKAVFVRCFYTKPISVKTNTWNLARAQIKQLQNIPEYWGDAWPTIAEYAWSIYYETFRIYQNIS